MNNSLRALLSKRFHIPKERSIQRATRHFTSAEKAIFYFFITLFIGSTTIMLLKVNNSFLVRVPIEGGSVSEGVISNPRFINPVLAISEADKNLVSLIYSGLTKKDLSGDMVNDLAEKVDISEDGLTYTVTLKDGVIFHDGEPVTADDVVFTIQKILDPGVKSPLYRDFAGVIVNKIDEETVSFTLKRPYFPFINNLSVGILPKHIWSSVTNDEFSFSQWNVLPIGSGPYMVETVTRDSGGIPNFYDLTPFERSTISSPYISHYIFKFYPSEEDRLEAYNSGEIEVLSGVSPEETKEIEKRGGKILSSPLPRVFGVFFNQNSNKALLDKSVRQALDLTAPKEMIVEEVLGNFGNVIHGPLPPGIFEIKSTSSPLTLDERFELASSTLTKAGWKKNTETGILEKKSKNDTIKLSFSISTSDNPDLKNVAEMLKASWQILGAEVSVSIYESGDLNQNVIRPRRYDALLFGEIVGRDTDIYPFWHSSERNDPGLNIALYTNSQVDKIIESIQTEGNKEKRENLYKTFDQIIRSDVPAVFLYSPDFIYVVPESIKGVEFGSLNTSQDRFSDIRNWFIETNAVWNIFANNY